MSTILNRECDYSLRILRCLSDGNKKTVEEICRQESIPEPFAYKLLNKLCKNGFLTSFRGRDGGYQLARELHNSTILDVMYVVNPNYFFFECLRKEGKCPNKEGKKPCKIHDFLKQTQNVLIQQLKSSSLYEIFLSDDQNQESVQDAVKE